MNGPSSVSERVNALRRRLDGIVAGTFHYDTVMTSSESAARELLAGVTFDEGELAIEALRCLVHTAEAVEERSAMDLVSVIAHHSGMPIIPGDYEQRIAREAVRASRMVSALSHAIVGAQDARGWKFPAAADT
ncbi:hypothetical protein [Methylopila sp. M107]|uniref:hypothetical protein n=1 Tax=Methylopila sp. M107 TaxID=1101190 RepID=UPI000365A9C9|nr:hypothetical protein [Methylopila sp. M107]